MNPNRKTLVCEMRDELCTEGRCPSFEKFKDPRTGEIPKCRHWVEIVMEEEKTGEKRLVGDCAAPWAVTLLLNMLQRTVGTTAAVESFRNEMVKLSAQAVLLENKNRDKQ